MNRCKKSATTQILLALSLGLASAVGPLATDAQAQVSPEAVIGGRNFPTGTLRGKLLILNAPEVMLDGQPGRLSPGARIRSPQNMLVMVGAIQGQKFLVNYTRDPAGLVSQVWILTPEEASIERETAERPFLNFWPFVAASRPHDDGKTPFDQLPKYGE
ncbi:hypothetical protein [Variovorax sp. dw_954]|uniref:hypothetical protein n=1 Tax=Variovorax sp. dw_954 TaxID=2720078 RepID=UPI001BD3A81B|nr:hypothetical protein [Variovorax sp. dw_954]